MFDVGSYVVHPGQGVCLVEDAGQAVKDAYKLMPIGQRHPVTITFPIQEDDRLRPIISHDEALSLIDAYPQIEVDTYSDRSIALEEEHFKCVIRTASCREMIRIVKTFRVRITEVKARNKKPPVAYERILKTATTRSLLELSVALGATPDAVCELFEDRTGYNISLN